MECKVRDIRIYYEEIGTGTPLLMPHGSHADHREMMHKMEPSFEQRQGWRRIYLDLPGRGRTPGASWMNSHQDILEVVLEFLDAIAPKSRFAVAGYSYGSYIAQGITLRRNTQMSGIMLAVPPVELERTKVNLPLHQILVHDEAFVAALEADEHALVNFAVVQSMEVLEAFRAEVKPGFSVGDHELINRIGAAPTSPFDMSMLPEPLPAPALILAGRQDAICGYREGWGLLESLPRGTFAVLDRAGHLLSADQRHIFQVLVGEWLDRVEEFLVQC